MRLPGRETRATRRASIAAMHRVCNRLARAAQVGGSRRPGTPADGFVLEISMKRVVLAACAILLAALAGCSVLSEPYSCGGGLNWRDYGDTNGRSEPIRTSSGATHC
jgi:hypothetical protein